MNTDLPPVQPRVIQAQQQSPENDVDVALLEVAMLTEPD